MSEYTKGPWRLSRERGGARETIHAENGSLLADVYLTPRVSGDGFANARLIAAAPDLLEAAKDVCRTEPLVAKRIEEGSLSTHDHAVMALGAAVKRAEGKA